MIFYDVLSLFLFFIFPVILIFGFVLSLKYSFQVGAYFFLILILKEFYSFIARLYFRNMDGVPPMGLTMGEWVTWNTMIPRLIELSAFGVLVIGLYRMWKHKHSNL